MNKIKPTPKTIDILVGENVRRLRELAGISQKEFARKVNVPCRQIQNGESGIDRISADHLLKFSKLLNVKVVEFFEGRDVGGTKSTTFAGDKISSLVIPENELKLLRLIKSCEPSVKKAVLSLIMVKRKNERADLQF